MSTIRTVDRTFAILQIVAQNPSGIGVSAVADHLSLAKSTVSRLLAAMQSWGVVERTADNRFCIGPEPARWVHQQSQNQTLAERMMPILRRIAEKTNEATAFCLLEEDELLYQENLPSNQNIQMRDWKGERLPPHTVSPGKLLLAYASEEAIERYLSKSLVALTKKSVTDPQILKTQLAAIREQGYAITDEEFDEGIIGMAIPITEHIPAEQQCVPLEPSSVVAAVCVYGPKFRIDSLTQQMAFIHTMQAAVNSPARSIP